MAQANVPAPPAARRWITRDTTIPDLVRQLGDDSRRLLNDEVRLAKLEMRDAVHETSHAAVWLAVSFAATAVAAVAATVCVATVIGRIAAGHMWVGAIVAGAIDFAAGAIVVKKGVDAFASTRSPAE
ncbi:MAG: phage holin family protein [Gemmatimonadaceae bacterium]